MNQELLIKKLQAENTLLQQQLETERKNHQLQNTIFLQQSKMAAMGEMIGNIAHQWRQPLMEISSMFIDIESQVRFTNQVSNEELLSFIKKSNAILKYMSQTIDDFKNFYSKDKKVEPFKIVEQIKRVVNIVSHSLKNKNIKVNVVVQANPEILGFQNEYSQVVLNIIANAKDILVQRNIENPIIDVKVFTLENQCITEITDNGGGIKIKNLEEIFKPFVTFDKQDGTGVGLFMSKLIIENNMKGQLSVENTQNGAKFKIVLPIAS